MSEPATLWAVVGPTGAGKTNLALDLAERTAGEIVSVDSAQVFVGLDVGTAKPSIAERSRARHHVIDVISPCTQWSAADFVRAADAAIADIRARRGTPILCGGTGLWMRALVRGIFEAPAIDAALRAKVRRDLEERGAEAMHAELVRVDPDAARRIAPRDPQRIGRALEVFLQTGTPISTLQAQHGFRTERYRLVGVAPAWPAAELRLRLDARVRRMYREGMVEEVEQCLRDWVPARSPGLSIIGYRDVVAMLEGRASRAEAEEATFVATRQYAKRQRNWFNHESAVEWIDPRISALDLLGKLRSRSRV